MALAALLAVSITALHGNSDRARHAQLVVAQLNTEVNTINGLEWQATAEGRVSRELGAELHLVGRQMDRRVDEYRRSGAADGPLLEAEELGYDAAVRHRVALLAAGRVAQGKRVDEQEVDPSFQRLRRRLRRIDAAETTTGDRAAGLTDIGVLAGLLLAGLGFVVLLSRLNKLRTTAAREKHDDLEMMALHDALTGMPNRRKLLVDLEGELRRTSAGESSFLVLCDLDGFKAYNDTFGHPEGDLLLGRLGRRLARTVAPHGTAYRLGGDEFCALLHVDEHELGQTVAACHAALRESGSGFDVQASIGSVALSEEASDSSTALRLADQRMYAQKNQNGSSARQQLRDVMLRVISEQDPELYDHANGVARLVAGVGRRHGLNDAEVANLVRAAELHDIGKVAIPDSILQKPGPLDPDEQEFLRRHTLIGQNILNAAPALAGIGPLVRSSHERIDGSGYPDGLRGEEIPLSSRIIFVCDSFSAMTSNRPYSPAVSEDDAVMELRRCSGTQFDPAVVDMFVAELLALNRAHEDAGDQWRRPEPATATVTT